MTRAKKKLLPHTFLFHRFPPHTDVAVTIISSVCMFFFILELVLNSWSKSTIKTFVPFTFDGYLFTFYWWLDLIAIVSMWFDIPWIAGPMGIGDIVSSVSGAGNLAKAGRVVRLVRLVRLVKLFRIASERRKRARQEAELMELVQIGAISYADIEKQRALNNERKSKLGSELSESTTKRVIVIVLIMVCVLPLLAYPVPNYGPGYITNMLEVIQMDPSVTAAARSTIYNSVYDALRSRAGENYLHLLNVKNGSHVSLNIVDRLNYGNLRDTILDDHDVTAKLNGVTYEVRSVFSLRTVEYDSASYSIIMTLFIGGLLVIGSVVFVGDTERLVLKPIGRMMNMVEEVAKDPLSPLNIGDNGGEYETRLLEITIEKITGLLRVGFGEAGAGIISANLSAENGSSSINPLLPGVRVYAIVGFCDIHKFEFANQQLASDILQFVNTIAEIVHSRVHYWGGQCNKNLGNAFVIIWRIGDEETIKEQISGFSRKSLRGESVANMNSPALGNSPSVKASKKMISGPGTPDQRTKSNFLDLRRVPGVDILADKALIGYLKIIAEINRDPGVLKYRNEPRLTLNGREEFKVRMGFGLHAGWAIEGAVGSLQKVDATYLSPHVNMAARLETSSRQYGVPILISHFTHELFSPEVQQLCRRVDVCTVKGSEVPIGVFTYDCVQDRLFPPKARRSNGEEWCPEDGPQVFSKKKTNKMSKSAGSSSPLQTKRKKSLANPDLDDLDTSKIETEELDNGYSPYFGKASEDTIDVFDNDTDMVLLREHVTEDCKPFY